jgi:hypothetical protein
MRVVEKWSECAGRRDGRTMSFGHVMLCFMQNVELFLFHPHVLIVHFELLHLPFETYMDLISSLSSIYRSFLFSERGPIGEVMRS